MRSSLAVSAIPEFLGRAYAAVMRAPTSTVQIEAGFPIGVPFTPAGDAEAVVPSELPGGTLATATHIGPYETMTDTYSRLTAWIAGQGLVPAEVMWEVYPTDPEHQPDPATWRTQVFWPVSRAAVAAER